MRFLLDLALALALTLALALLLPLNPLIRTPAPTFTEIGLVFHDKGRCRRFSFYFIFIFISLCLIQPTL